jgi:hypothetical protein
MQVLVRVSVGHRNSFQRQENPDGVVVIGRERGDCGSSVAGLGCLVRGQEVHQLTRQRVGVTVMCCGRGTDGVGLNRRQLVQDVTVQVVARVS